MIDRVATGLVTQVTQPAQIDIQLAQFMSKTVGALTIATFKVQLPTTYQSGGYLIIKLP